MKTIRQPRYSKEEHARRGTDLYEQQVRPQVEAGNDGKDRFCGIDVDSGDFAVAGQRRLPRPTNSWPVIRMPKSGFLWHRPPRGTSLWAAHSKVRKS